MEYTTAKPGLLDIIAFACLCVVVLLGSLSSSLKLTEPSAIAPQKADVWLMKSNKALLKVLIIGTFSKNGVKKSKMEKSKAFEAEKEK